MNTQVPATRRGDATRADASTLTTTKPSAPLWKAIAPIAVAVVLVLLPAPSGLPHHAWYFFAIFVGVTCRPGSRTIAGRCYSNHRHHGSRGTRPVCAVQSPGIVGVRLPSAERCHQLGAVGIQQP